MATAWRLSKAKHVDTALSGEGAFLVAGRWNHRGKRRVYASQSLSLAALETLVHIDNVGLLASYLYCRIDLPDGIIERLASPLPVNWKDEDDPTRTIGDAWIDGDKSAVLAVPNAIVETELNYLINPNHPDFSSNPDVRIGDF